MPETKAQRYTEAVGRRKQAVARVRLYDGTEGKTFFTVNGKDVNDYFPIFEMQSIVREALSKAKAENYSVSVLVKGGGMEAHAEAIRHGISRALASIDEEWKRKLKKAGILKHDPRQKERKKFGKKKARKSPQWSKR